VDELDAASTRRHVGPDAVSETRAGHRHDRADVELRCDRAARRDRAVSHGAATRQRPPSGAADNLVDTEAVYAFAQEFREKNLGKYIHVERLGGFCVLLKRQVLDKIGMASLEKWTDLSLFDTDILSTKARQAGFTLAVCRDLFIHHFGTRTFSAGAPEANRKLQEVRHAN
jgi:GT2 family glycosyltransferase